MAEGYPCTACGGATRVIDTRSPAGSGRRVTPYLRRRRRCTACAKLVTTYEFCFDDAGVPGVLLEQGNGRKVEAGRPRQAGRVTA